MKKKYKIIADPTYGYLRVDPVPTQEEVERYYLEEFYSSDFKRFNDSSFGVQLDEKEFFDGNRETICKICKDHFGAIKDLSLFDIGFGFAQSMLYFRKRGFQVSGLEPSREGVDYAKSQGLEVYQAGIEDFSCVESKRFDVVSLINVLEHLRDPAKTLTEIKNKLLKKRGLLVIDVPNEFNDFQVVANKEFYLKDWWVCPPSHINYFSGTSLQNLLVKCGYKIILKESSFPLEMFLLMGDVYVGDSKLGKKCHQKRVKFEHLMRKHGKSEKLSQLYRHLAELDLGRQMVIYASPNDKR